MESVYGQDRYFPSKDEDRASKDKRSEKLEKYLLNETAKPVVHLYYRDLQTDRMIAQQSTSTVCENILVNHTEAIGNVLDSRYCVKATIPKDKKSEYLARLHVMNINAASLFPGIDGMGQYLTEVAHIRAFTWAHSVAKIDS
jgi:hypothetical protein